MEIFTRMTHTRVLNFWFPPSKFLPINFSKAVPLSILLKGSTIIATKKIAKNKLTLNIRVCRKIDRIGCIGSRRRWVEITKNKSSHKMPSKIFLIYPTKAVKSIILQIKLKHIKRSVTHTSTVPKPSLLPKIK